MFLDALMLFDPAGTAITATATSTNVYDAGADRDLGSGSPKLDILVLVQQAFAAAGAATLQVSLQGAVDNGSGAAGTYYDFVMTGVLPKANLTLGRALLRTAMPLNQPAASNTDFPARFYRLNYTVATGPFTAGTVEAAVILSDGRQDNVGYASGFSTANI